MRCVTDDPRLDLTIGFPRRAAGASSTARHVGDRAGFVNFAAIRAGDDEDHRFSLECRAATG